MNFLKFVKRYSEKGGDKTEFIRVVGKNGCINIPLEIAEKFHGLEITKKVNLIKHDGQMISQQEIDESVVWPTLNEFNDDIIEKLIKK